jgi:glycosyltransferase involved in cell wall biosynthesis
MISVIIATRDDETRLAMALSALVAAATEGLVREVIVVDRGSRDGTAIVADAAGCNLVSVPADVDGRRDAAEQARADWLLFLPPAAMLEPGWQGAAEAFFDEAIESGDGRRRAACFRLGRMEQGARARLGELGAVFRSRLLAAPHEEQGLLIPKALYRSLGGHRDMPALAGVDLTRRIGRRRLRLLRARALVRASRETKVDVGAALRTAICLALFVMRVPPRLIGRLAG